MTQLRYKKGGRNPGTKDSHIYGQILLLDDPLGQAGEKLRSFHNLSLSKIRLLKMALLAMDDSCTYCGKKLVRKTATLDHIEPKCRGGSNKRSNLTLACQPCNRKKGHKTLSKFGK